VREERRPVLVPVLGEIVGWEALLVLGVIVLLFGGSQLPKLARSLGSARSEFEKGQREHEDPPDPKDGQSS